MVHEGKQKVVCSCRVYTGYGLRKPLNRKEKEMIDEVVLFIVAFVVVGIAVVSVIVMDIMDERRKEK